MAKDNKIVKSFSTDFIQQVKAIITAAQYNAVRAVSTERVMMYWNIGKKIFVEEQNGKERAAYGAYITKHLSAELTNEFGSGFTIRQLEFCRQFYKAFPITNALRS